VKFDLAEIQKRMDSLKKPEPPAPKGLPPSKRERAESAKKREIKKMRENLGMGE